MDNIIIRELTAEDFNIGYFELMLQFTNYNYDVNETYFKNYITNNVANNKIIIIYSNIEKKIIGAGSIYLLKKLHNNGVGQIEDVMIDECCRGKGFGKLIIEKLIDIGINELNCYKIILNCLDKNVDFYKKCGFIVAGNEMKYTK
jgi:glucosamine-phosphate N-acetyltransferase